jgi:hypothetical protein
MVCGRARRGRIVAGECSDGRFERFQPGEAAFKESARRVRAAREICGGPGLIFLAIVLSFIPHDMMYGPQAALIAECFTARLRYSGSSLGFHLASVVAGGPAPLIATALFAATGSGYSVALYILFCAVVSISATVFLPDFTNRDISQEHDALEAAPRPAATS